jgi:hypothetical protein
MAVAGFSSAPSGLPLIYFLLVTYGSRRGRHFAAASRLAKLS